MSKSTYDKTALVPEFRKMKIHHPNAEEYASKLLQDDDCFAVIYDENAAACKACQLKVTYENVDYTMAQMCSRFMNAALVVKRVVDATGDNAGSPEALADEKDAKLAKKLKRIERKKNKILELIRQGISTSESIAKSMDYSVTKATLFIEKLIDDGKVERVKEGDNVNYVLKK